jgi:tricorn protease
VADVDVVLTVNSKPTMEGARTVRVRPAGDEGNLRYHDWVESNRAYVDKVSGGEYAYVHIPDMGAPGLTEFFRQWFPQLHKKGLVFDVRYNGGGFVSQLLIHRLRRQLYAIGNVRNFDSSTYPSAVFNGPMVLITNENAGSDGDIISESWRLFDLGPIIGMRSWGGVIGIRSDKPFMDGGLITVPEFGWWEPKRGWDLENTGVVPDIEIDITPEDQLAGRDPQLDKAIEVLGELMKTNPPKSLETSPIPGNPLERFRERTAEWMTKP